jgi:hypothetical protein
VPVVAALVVVVVVVLAAALAGMAGLTLQLPRLLLSIVDGASSRAGGQ